MRSPTVRNIVLGLAATMLLAPGLAQAATKADAEAALAAARKAEAAAAAVHNRWLPTEASLKLATKDLAAGKFDDAVAAAKRAEALAKISVQQAKEQASLWQNEVIR